MSEEEDQQELKLTPEEEEQADNMLRMHGDVLAQLMQHQRFVIFLHANYDVQLVMNQEEKTVKYVVMEHPSDVAADNMLKLTQQIRDENPQIEVASEAMLKELEKIKNS